MSFKKLLHPGTFMGTQVIPYQYFFPINLSIKLVKEFNYFFSGNRLSWMNTKVQLSVKFVISIFDCNATDNTELSPWTPWMIKRRNFSFESPCTSDKWDQTIARFIQKDYGCSTLEFFLMYSQVVLIHSCFLSSFFSFACRFGLTRRKSSPLKSFGICLKW